MEIRFGETSEMMSEEEVTQFCRSTRPRADIVVLASAGSSSGVTALVIRLISSWAVEDRTVMVQLIEETLRLINLKHSPDAVKEKSKYLAFLGLISC